MKFDAPNAFYGLHIHPKAIKVPVGSVEPGRLIGSLKVSPGWPIPLRKKPTWPRLSRSDHGWKSNGASTTCNRVGYHNTRRRHIGPSPGNRFACQRERTGFAKFRNYLSNRVRCNDRFSVLNFDRLFTVLLVLLRGSIVSFAVATVMSGIYAAIE